MTLTNKLMNNAIKLNRFCKGYINDKMYNYKHNCYMNE